MTELFQLGVSALTANQASLVTTGHNIANADTEGYSRQEALKATTAAQRTASGFLGSGVTLEGVRRVYDEFLTRELQTTASGFHQFDIISENAKQLDNLLGDESTSLAPSLQRFFAGLQDVANNPASSAARQMLLSEASLLENRFDQAQNRLSEQNEAINTQLESLTTELNTLAAGIADLNGRIAGNAAGTTASLPNDLLDKRDQLVLRIAEIVQVETVEAPDRTLSVFIGKGQGLVVGNRSFGVSAEPSEADPTRNAVIFKQGSANLDVTQSLVSGRLGGLLSFRDTILDDAYNQLGLVALGLNYAINEQHQRGMDLDNETGNNFFEAVNSTTRMRARAISDPDNAGVADRVVEVEIADMSAITTSDYVLELSSSSTRQYTVTRQSDRSVVAQGTFSGSFPSEVEADGMIVRLVSGSFAAGDRFTLQPTRNESRALSVSITNVRDLALAQPIRTLASEGNRGSGGISQGTVLDTRTQAFTSDGSDLNPPVLIRFTGPRTYDVLDNSVPGSPVDLVPPIKNRVYVPGVDNFVFSENEGETVVSFNSSAIGVGVNSSGTNGYSAETLTFATIDPDTGALSRQVLSTAANDSAESIASAVDLLSGVSATATNQVVLSDIRSVSPLSLTFNGQVLLGSDPDTLSDSINNNATLTQQGISASSDGSQVTIRSSQGGDFHFQVGGAAAGDRVTFTGLAGSATTVTASDALPDVTFGGTVQVVMDEGVSVSGLNNLVPVIPTAVSTFRGYQVALSGNPAEGDEFAVEFNTGGFADNRNALEMANIQIRPLLLQGSSTLQDVYSNLVNGVGTRTQESAVSREAAEVLFDRAKNERSEKSGVNLDEEAARLIEFELAYNAAAQLITVARSLFDTLLAAAQ
ncbi:MAG: flagellar hook-associated protein FlgK [Gammaproteobacteria bacterium]